MCALMNGNLNHLPNRIDKCYMINDYVDKDKTNIMVAMDLHIQNKCTKAQQITLDGSDPWVHGTLKAAILGATGVGKTAILQVKFDIKYSHNSIPHIRLSSGLYAFGEQLKNTHIFKMCENISYQPIVINHTEYIV